MGDLFDIANLITTVGVDRIKIKPESGLPEKSSNEILTELFSTFDAEEEIGSSENTDQQVPNANIKLEKLAKAQIKKKKAKKKHKHKDKKHKKKSKRNSSESNSDLENVKKKKKHKKKTKRRHENDSSRSSDSDEPKRKISKLDTTCNNLKKKSHGKDSGNLDGLEDFEKLLNNKVAEVQDTFDKEPASPQLPPISKKIQEEPEEQLISKILEKPKPPNQGKILIKDLKNSTVYNETVKEIENKEKEKAARMEDGELSDSSSDNRTPTLSPSPLRCASFRSPTLSPTLEKTENRVTSPSKGEATAKHDLRFVLREKEKKRLGDADKRLDGTEKSKLYMDNEYKEKTYNYGGKIAASKDSKHGHNCHSQERKRSESRTRTNLRRSRSRGRDKRRDKSRDRYDKSRSSDRRESLKCRERRRHRSRSDDRSRDKHVRGRSRSRERKERIEIDKKKLLEIARRNAINMIKQGTLPLVQQDKAIAAIQAGGKTVDELTDFCKSLSKSEALGELSSISSEEDGSESEKGFHHPFLLKGRPNSIIMNIRDAKQLPTKTFQEKTVESSNQLRLQFPVSSGQHHRKSENEWIPVTPKKPEPKKQFIPATVPPEPPAVMPPTPAVYPVQPTVFTQPVITETIDIGSIVSQRLAAMRKLKENPNDVCAQNEMYRAQNEMKTWAESKQMPGQFTGSTGAKVLSPAELTSGYQAWARKVKVNGIEYKPSVASPNKKQAKAEAAQICLQTLGLLPEPSSVPAAKT